MARKHTPCSGLINAYNLLVFTGCGEDRSEILLSYPPEAANQGYECFDHQDDELLR